VGESPGFQATVDWTTESTGSGKGQTAYVVTSGTYSDYRIQRIYTDRALAESFMERLKASTYCADEEDGPRIEEWAVTDRVPNQVRWHTAQGDSSRLDQDLQLNHEDHWDDGAQPPTDPYTTEFGGGSFRVYSKDRERAIKVASDRLAFERAKAEGLT
jgi:hypothetical protein